MNRSDFKRLARIRSQEAGLLLKKRKSSGAYYLCGYVIECALKACIAQKTRRYDFPDKKQTDASYTHDLEKLMQAADLKSQLEIAVQSNLAFATFWGRVKDWSEQSRYRTYTQQEAQLLYDAVHDPTNGVFRWVQQYW